MPPNRGVPGSDTTTSETGLWDSVERLGVGQSFSFTFQTPGEYAYYCNPHRDRGMVGKVIVTPSGR
jgi:plastocyanin